MLRLGLSATRTSHFVNKYKLETLKFSQFVNLNKHLKSRRLVFFGGIFTFHCTVCLRYLPTISVLCILKDACPAKIRCSRLHIHKGAFINDVTRGGRVRQNYMHHNFPLHNTYYILFHQQRLSSLHPY